MITSVIFDLDDTLCDYAGAKRRGLDATKPILARHAVDSATFFARYQTLEPPLFRNFMGGQLSKAQYRQRRFADVLAEMSLASVDLATELNQTYMAIANEQVQLFDDVGTTLSGLRKRKIAVAVLTNGPSDGQRTKLRRCGLIERVEHIFISEELGAAKPAPACFLAVAAALRQPLARILMVGDSISDDVEAPAALGMRAVLIDRLGSHRDYRGQRISRLSELLGLLDRYGDAAHEA